MRTARSVHDSQLMMVSCLKKKNQSARKGGRQLVELFFG